MLRLRKGLRWLVHLLAGTMVLLGLVVLGPTVSSTAEAATLCSGRSWFGGLHYCPATIEGVAATRYGTGRRVWLDSVHVLTVRTDTVTVSQLRQKPCSPDAWSCLPDYYRVELVVPWSGTHRPKVSDMVRLYGTTTVGTMDPAGYVRTGTCDPYLGDIC